MALTRLLLRLAAAVLLVTATASDVATPALRKVVEMLEGMSKKAKQEMAEEEKAFEKFSTWCEMESGRMHAEVAKAEEEIQQLSAEIGKLETHAAGLGKEVTAENVKLEHLESKRKAITERRQKDHAAFLEESSDLAESVDALERALEVVQEQDYDRPGTKAALVQLADSRQLPSKARSILSQYAVLLDSGAGQEGPTGFDVEAPEANAYEFQSGGIVNVLTSLKDKFQGKLDESQREEMKSKHAYDMIMLSLADAGRIAERQVREKSAEQGRMQEKAALDKKRSASTAEVKGESEKTLATVTAECSQKTAAFEEKQGLRSEEAKAIQKAIEILKSPEVQETSKKYLAMLQMLPRRATALVQVEGSKGRRHVRDFLAAESRRLRSKHLSLLAQKLAADPFAKVKDLIEAMIARLQDEAGADADHEGFCDKEMGKSKITRNKLTEDIDGLTAAVEEGKATILALAESTETLAGEVADLRRALGGAAEMRRDEKAKNTKAIKEAQAAQQAVQAAKAVLKDFYEKVLSAPALVQVPGARRFGASADIKMGSEEWKALANPALAKAADGGAHAAEASDGSPAEGTKTKGEAYQSQQDKAEYGVLTLLEVIQSDFEGLEADTKSAEAESLKAFEDFSRESKKSIAVKEKKIDMESADKAAAEDALAKDTSELKATQRELEAAERYHKQLVPQCVDQGMSFEDRKKAREAEVASLKQALEILSTS